jgi:membrane protein YdbS with pleckstrin-like domain
VAISRKHLADDEHVVLTTRSHVKAMLLPAIVLIVTAGVAGYLSTLPRGSAATPLRWLIVLAALIVIGWLAGARFLNWLFTTYTVTNRRLITRTGVVTRRGHDIPLPRISDVASERGPVDRMLGCGTLVLADASDKSVKLHDIPHVEHVQVTINKLLTGHIDREAEHPQSRRIDDGT